VSAIPTKKANAPKRLVSMRLLNLVTNHLETRKIEIRCDPEQLSLPSDYGAEILRVQTIHGKRRQSLKQALIFITLMVLPSLALGQMRSTPMEEEVLRTEREFSQAIVHNDAEEVGRFLIDDWIIIDPDGGIIDKAQFLSVIKSATLTHDMMESHDMRVRIYGDIAIVTALTSTKGKFNGQGFATQERATDVFVKQSGRWQCTFSQLTRFAQK
jgi:ketosteroid isomerase-like protein